MPVYDQEIVDTTPNYLQSKSYSAQKDRTWFADFISAGVFSDSDFALSLLGGLAYRMSVGKAYVLGQQVADQGMYRISSLANADLAVGAGHVSLPRLDQVILRVMDNTHDGAGFNEARIETVPGTATAGATLDNRSGAANLTTLGEASKNVYLLYDILMPSAASSISGGNVRRRATVARLGFGTIPAVIPLLTVAQFQALRDIPNGLEVYVVVDVSNGHLWHLRYNSAIGDAYKWQFLGGPPLYSVIGTSEYDNGGWINWPTVGPDIVAPLAGYYLGQAMASYTLTYLDGGSLMVGLSHNGDIVPTYYGGDGASRAQADGSFGISGNPGHLWHRYGPVTAGQTFRMRYSGFGNAYHRHINLMPVRLSQ
jgi:hypothetical protein